MNKNEILKWQQEVWKLLFEAQEDVLRERGYNIIHSKGKIKTNQRTLVLDLSSKQQRQENVEVIKYD